MRTAAFLLATIVIACVREPTLSDAPPVPQTEPVPAPTPAPAPAGSLQGCGHGGERDRVVRLDFEGSWSWVAAPAVIERPLPLLVVLHGDEGDPNNMRAMWEPVWAAERDFVLMAPECPRALCNKGGVNTWSAGSWDGSEPQAIWLEAALADLATRYPIDASRIHAVGYSGGAILLGYQGFKRFQDTFASIQWFCGGVNETREQVYAPPEDPACKVAGRLLLSRSGDYHYMVTAADRVMEILAAGGHHHELVDTACAHHCCDAAEWADDMWRWARARGPKCEAELAPGCHAVDATP